jgi:CRISPR-associated protein Csc1
MQILQCDLTLLENTFFSSREIGNFYQTEPVIGNYALCYALGLAAASYFNSGSIHYAEHLAALNAAGVYVTPAAVIGKPRFTVEMFNAQPDSYWFAMGNNALIVKPDGWDVELGSASYLVNRADRNQRRKVPTSNRPQVGTIKMLGIGNRARFYIVAKDTAPRLPRYLRLGKWMSKARLETSEIAYQAMPGTQRQVRILLNPVDLAAATRVHTFDMLSIHPAPLIRNSVMDGDFLELSDKDRTLLPAGMRFGVEAMTNAR